MSPLIIASMACLQSGEAFIEAIHDASVFSSSALAFGASHAWCGSATLAASAFIWLTASSSSSQILPASSLESGLPPSVIGKSKSSSSVTSRKESLKRSA